MQVEIGKAGVSLAGKQALEAMSLSLRAGEVTGLVGPNGAGKSTLLKLMAGLLTGQDTQVKLNGKSISNLTARERARQIAWLSQSRELSWDLSAVDVVALGRHAWGGGRYDRLGKADREIVLQAMQQAGASSLAGRHVLSLSGGEQARVHLARLLAAQADCLLLDEPLAALDIAQQLNVMSALNAEAARGRTVCLALHDLQLARESCDRLIVLDKGWCVADGHPDIALRGEILSSVFGVRLSEQGRFELPAR